MASVALLGLVEGEALELTSCVSDVLPQEVSRLVGSYARELTTRGHGACALRAAFGMLPELFSA